MRLCPASPESELASETRCKEAVLLGPRAVTASVWSRRVRAAPPLTVLVSLYLELKVHQGRLLPHQRRLWRE